MCVIGNTNLEVKFVPKQREMLQKFRVSLKISWEPGSLVPGEYPTLPGVSLKTHYQVIPSTLYLLRPDQNFLPRNTV